MLIVFGFALLLLCSCAIFAYFGEKWNLKPLVSLGAGALLSICFLDFLPQAFEGAKSFEMSAFFVLLGVLAQGLADIYLLPRLGFLDKWLKTGAAPPAHSHSHTLSSGSVCSLAGCLAICSFFDGIRLFSALNIEGFVAAGTALALFFHLLSEGGLVAVLALSSGIKARALIALVFCLPGSLILGALSAQLFFISFSPELLIAFSAGILIYICFIHLLPFCLQKNSRYWLFAGLIALSAAHFAL